ncbi:CidA/LrgA family protein [Novosphingobium sp. RD2P27]|uniref:CidA/LrgA family protein n=1 Tax=Novosphingobium kalidii TaxID=3230299 RepID=A0ABV2D1S3_9SPHN
MGLWALGEALRNAVGLPLPGGVIGCALLYGLLHIRPQLAAPLEPGCDLLIAHLILFFIPAVLSIIAYPALFGTLGTKLLFTLVAGTVIMMVSVGLLAQFLSRRPAVVSRKEQS